MYLKYRPKKLEDVLGNAPIKKALVNLTYNRPILFEGTKGCGKSTLAYIVCAMNNIPPEAIKTIDCVNISGVADMREEIEGLTKTSLLSDKRALILDELHGLSDKAKQSLLTPFENESILSRAIIIACTTELKSIPGTLLDRFQRFKVQPLSEVDSKTLISTVMVKEGITLSDEIEALLLKESDGVPRRLLNGLSKLRNVTDIDEAKYLLYLDEIEGYEDILYLIKLLMKNVSWSIFKDKLRTLYKKYSPNAIRVGLMNLISTRLVSGYPTDDKMIKLYNYLREYDKYPEKAELTVALYQWVNLK